MKPEELEVGAVYWIVKYSNVIEGVFQGTLVGRSESAQKGYLFLTEGVKVQVLWPLDLPLVSDNVSQCYYHLHKQHLEQAEKFRLLYEKTLTNQ